jgi:hypothetical protein
MTGRLARFCLSGWVLMAAAAMAAMPSDWTYTPHRPANQPPAAAVARCGDGSWGLAVRRGRVCAGHRGVAKWLRRSGGARAR